MNGVPGNGHAPPPEVRMTVVWRPGSVTVEGAPADRVMAYGMLDMAREIILRGAIEKNPALQKTPGSSIIRVPPGARLE